MERKPTYEELEQKIKLLENKVELFDKLLEISPIYLFFKDKDIKTITLSRNYEKMIGLPVDQLIGKTMNELFPSELAKQMIEDDKQILRNNQVFEVEEEFNGRTMYTVKFPLILKDNTKILAGYTIDNTDKLEAEKALRESEEKYRKIIETTSKGFCLLEKSGKIIDVNPAFCNLTGYTKAELLQMEITDIDQIPHDQDPDFHFNQTIERGHDCFETYHKRKNGELLPVEIEISYLPLQTGVYIVFINDISERKKTEKQISKYTEELNKLNQGKDQFMQILAHDLRNPFNTLLGFTNMLLEDIHDFSLDEIENQLKFINQISGGAYNLLEDLLLWSQSQSGKLSFEPEKLIFSEICNEVIRSLKGNADTKKIKIDCQKVEDVVFNADLNMLKTILRNLVSNAVKFTNKSGYISISAHQECENIVISISDNGVGIEAENQKKLWDLSQKFTQKGTANEKGSGLGLTLCKEFVEKHGGKIWVESEVDKGSTFKFTMPV